MAKMVKAKAKATKKTVTKKVTKKATTNPWSGEVIAANVQKNAEQISKNIMKNAETIGNNVARNSKAVGDRMTAYLNRNLKQSQSGWGCSSVGRATGLQPVGRRFDPYHLHHLTK